jgi:hypothetical protein
MIDDRSRIVDQITDRAQPVRQVPGNRAAGAFAGDDRVDEVARRAVRISHFQRARAVEVHDRIGTVIKRPRLGSILIHTDAIVEHQLNRSARTSSPSVATSQDQKPTLTSRNHHGRNPLCRPDLAFI